MGTMSRPNAASMAHASSACPRTTQQTRCTLPFVATVETFSDPKFCIDVLKLESPIPAAHLPQPGSDGSAAAQAWFDKIGNAATVP